VRAELAWIDGLPHKHKLVIAGNHDFFFDERYHDGFYFRNWRIKRPITVAEVLAEAPAVTYLQDSSATIDGVKFYGSPWQPNYYDWAFQFPANDGGVAAKQHWEKIPTDTNILITHGPPRGILDAERTHGRNVGDPQLRAAVEELMVFNLRAHIFGHIHESYGRLDSSEPPMAFINCAINTRDYNPYNKPIILDI